MHGVTIQYAVPDEPATFDESYFDRHVPPVAPIPGLRAFTCSESRPLRGNRSVHLLAQLDSRTRPRWPGPRLPEMQAAGGDAAQLGVPMTMFSGEVVERSLG